MYRPDHAHDTDQEPTSRSIRSPDQSVLYEFNCHVVNLAQDRHSAVLATTLPYIFGYQI